MADQPQAGDVAPLLAQFLDDLIPGDGSWPSASAVGSHGVPAERLLDLEGDDAVQKLVETLGDRGRPPDGRSSDERALGYAAEARAPWGRGHHHWFERHFDHGIAIHAIGDDLPNPENRVPLDHERRDDEGVPVAHLHDAPGENDRRMVRFMGDRLRDIAAAADAFECSVQDYMGAEGVYRTPAWHLLGACRMGCSSATSVVNRRHQAWDVPNLSIVDGGVFATGGVVNPTPTVSALALRAAGHLRDNFRELRATSRPLAA